MLGNSVVVLTYYLKIRKVKPLDYLTINLAFSDGLFALTSLTFPIASSFAHRVSIPPNVLGLHCCVV